MKSGMYPNNKEKIMRHFTNKEINELLTARIKGKTHIEIAASLGRTPKSVRAKMYAMNKLAPLPITLEELAENFDVWTQKKTTSLPKKARSVHG
jgi:DNA-binding CsgD family transcriptional regulator